MSEHSRDGGKRAAGRRRRKSSRRRRALVIAAWTVAAGVLLGGVGVGWFYARLNSNIKTLDFDKALGSDRPPSADDGAMNILVLGSDSRGGDNSEYGQDDGGSARSDTAMIVHLYAGHKKAAVVSIPRDTMVNRPSCMLSNGKPDPGSSRTMFNAAFSVGGGVCTGKTVEKMWGIRVDHYIEADFTGFKKIIDTLGGVEVTTTKPIKDNFSHLNLPAGTHKLGGEEALGLVRTRHGVGDGGDLGRIQLQQAFIKALSKQVKGIGLFEDPKKLLDLADISTKSLTTDKPLGDVNSLMGLAQSLKGIDTQDMQMITLPVTTDPIDHNRVAPLPRESKMVWDALSADQPIPAEATANSTGDKGTVGEIVR
ncbi:LCP family protein [Streptomyces erythrochromogenes]|uniref:LCP family protein n=1 Tax=Streptomyces erythrochromogenes TaxID=285574 RepID=UPI003689A29E